MDLTTKTPPCRVRVIATLDDDGSITVKVTGHAPYHTRPASKDAAAEPLIASADVDQASLPSDVISAVGAALVAARAAAEGQLAERVSDAISVSRMVARQKQEIAS